MRLGRWCGLLLALPLVIAARRPFVLAQPTCSVELGDGTPPLEVVINETPAHCGFLQFSWRMFFAMNWPALPADAANTSRLARGLPDHAKRIGQDDLDPTVWEQYQPNWSLFWPNNPPPPAQNGDSFTAWNRDAALPAACGPKNDALTPDEKVTRILSSLSKMDGMPGVVQASLKPLIDQDGAYARYEIRFNYPTFNYINKNQFYLKASQTATTTFDFPRQSGDAPGAVFVKAAWKVLGPDDDPRRFHTTKVWLFTPEASGVTPTCVGPVRVGLVGLHIVQKTENFPAQVWATFEHVDNTPFDPDHPGAQPRWSFFDAQSALPPNQAPACPSGAGAGCDWQPTSTHKQTTDPTGGPTKAVRTNPVPRSPNNEEQALNQVNESAVAAMRAVNASSVWQFYRLVEAQWPISPPNQPLAFFPSSRVANMTMETYQQTNSCMGCHRGARAANGKTADMSFELRLAWEPTVLPNPVP